VELSHSPLRTSALSHIHRHGRLSSLSILRPSPRRILQLYPSLTHTYTRTHVHAMHTHMYTCTHVHVDVARRRRTHAHAHTHVHMCTCTCTRSLPPHTPNFSSSRHCATTRPACCFSMLLPAWSRSCSRVRTLRRCNHVDALVVAFMSTSTCFRTHSAESHRRISSLFPPVWRNRLRHGSISAATITSGHS